MSVYRLNSFTLNILKNCLIKDFNVSSNCNKLLQRNINASSVSMIVLAKRNYSSTDKNVVSKSSTGTSNIKNQQKMKKLAIHDITKNIQLFASAPRNVERDHSTLKLKSPLHKPMVLIFAWLLAKQKHLAKYAEIYIEQGYDVLVVSITPWQLLWPVKGTQPIAKDVLKFLMNNENSNPIVIHGFSVGGYAFGELMVNMAAETEKYKPLLNRVIGQVWDSAADITEIPIGLPTAIFPKNATMRNALHKYMIYHLKTFHETATSHYIRSSQMFHSTIVKAPALFFVSNADPVGAVASNDRVRENWESLGMRVVWKCWDYSPHVGHYTKHKKEYLEILYSFLISLNAAKYPEKLRAKI